MSRVPRPALALALAGLLPFLWGALTVLRPDLGAALPGWIGPRFVGPYVQLFYGSVILSFMSGVLWGFATRTSGRRATPAYGLSVLPALWVFFMAGGGPESAATNLVLGFLGLLALDALYQSWGLAPRWWMALRLPVTAVVCLSYLPVIL